MAEVTVRPAIPFGGDRRPSAAERDAMRHVAHERCVIASSAKATVRCEPRDRVGGRRAASKRADELAIRAAGSLERSLARMVSAGPPPLAELRAMRVASESSDRRDTASRDPRRSHHERTGEREVMMTIGRSREPTQRRRPLRSSPC